MNPALLTGLAALTTLVFVAVDLRDRDFRSSWTSDRPRRTRNLSFLMANLVTMALLDLCTRFLEPTLPRLWDWGGLSAPWWLRALELVSCLLIAELINWISHWMKHRHPWLWRFHSQHHVETRYSVNLTLHTHGLEVIASGCAMAAVLTLCGFSRLAVDLFALTYLVTNFYKHTTARFTLGPLDRLVVSPAYHRLHHAVGHDGNFGSVLTVFDVVFGTARAPAPENPEAVYALPVGVATPEPFGFWDEMRAPFLAVPRTSPDPIGGKDKLP